MMKEIIKPIAVLSIICLVVTAVLAFVHMETSPIILAAEEKAAAQARTEVLPEAKDFEKIEGIPLPDGVTEAYRGSNRSGYVIISQAKGYGGTIRIICGIRPDGSIQEVKTLSHAETGGIGSRVADNASPYRLGYSGKTADTYGEVDAVTGATISSTAYKKAVGQAFEAYAVIKGAEA